MSALVLGAASITTPAARAATPRPQPSAAPKPAPRRPPHGTTSAPKPACVVVVTGVSGQALQCTGATSTVGADASGKPQSKTVIAFSPGASSATATFTAPGLPTASMHNSTEVGFTYEVTLTVGTQKWSAKRTAAEAGPPSALLRYTTSEGTGATLVSHGYAILPLAPVKESGATQTVQMRVDF